MASLNMVAQHKLLTHLLGKNIPYKLGEGNCSSWIYGLYPTSHFQRQKCRNSLVHEIFSVL